jgi:hypothetical protein
MISGLVQCWPPKWKGKLKKKKKKTIGKLPESAKAVED